MLAALLLLGGPAEKPSSDVAELLRLEAVWNDGHVKGDADALGRLWSDDLVVAVQGIPLLSRKESINVWRTGRMKFDEYETSDIRVRVYNDAGVVTGRLRRSRRVGGRTAADPWSFTRMYVHRDGQWQVVSWHASDVPPR